MSLRRYKYSTLDMSDTHFDYLVIGGGSGGMASARRAAGYGAKVAVIEKSALGGTCVNVGCVPKKVMFNAASVSETIHTSSNFGFEVKDVTFNWNALKVARDAYITRLNGIYSRMMVNNKIKVFDGIGTFVGPKSVKVNDQQLTADHILIAVGGKPYLPALPGIEHCISSDGFFKLDKQPKSVAVIGAGYIGVELAGVFHGLGTATTLFTQSATPLNGFDTLIVDTLTSEMKKQGIVFKPNENTKQIVKNADGSLTLIAESGTHGPFECVLFATGRTPLTPGLGLDAAGVKTDGRGFIEVDEYQQTAVSGVYALGDVCGKVPLTPTAIAAGRRLVDR
jgi:glutathione reductase (NADPH)